jgi:hypothetical protein
MDANYPLACKPTRLLLKKGVEKVKTYSNAGKDECHPKPDFPGDGHFPFNLQVIPESDAKEDNCQGYKHNSKRWKGEVFCGHSQKPDLLCLALCLCELCER